MIYEFLAPDGSIKEKIFPMSKAPELGAYILVDGVKCERIISDSVILAQKDDQRKFGPKYPYVSHSMRRHIPNCEHDNLGKPIISSAAHEREIMGQENLIRQ